MYADAADIAVAEFDLAGVQARSDLQADPLQLIPQGCGAADRPSWTIEGGQDAITGGLDQLALELLDHPAGQLIVHVQQLPPTLVSELTSPLGRVDDVGE
jgi:hypothetical protein